MWKRSLLGTGLAATLALGLAAPPSLATAATTWSVTPGGNFSSSLSSSSVIIKDTTTGIVITCSSSSISGKLKSGSGLAGANIASITAFSFGPSNSCAGPGGLTFTFTFGHFPYDLNAQSYASGETTTHITGIFGAMSGGFACMATIGGTSQTTRGQVKGVYTNSTHKLVTGGGTLHFYNVGAGCVGWFNTGDSITISATYTIKPGQAITSP